jgi:hypothetical protein
VSTCQQHVLLSEYLSTDIDGVLPEPIMGPDDAFDPGKEFLERLARVADAQTIPPRPAPVVFATTPEAIATNDRLMREHGFDLESLISSFQDTTLGYGSEFRPISQLEELLGGHP